MSLLPYFVEDYCPSLRPDDSGLRTYPGDLWHYRPERSLLRRIRNLEKNLFSDLNQIQDEAQIGKDGFQVCLDIQNFQPNEVSVKTVDNTIVIDAKHEERKDDHGYVSRQFQRRYVLPEGFKTEDVVSTISSDGILTVKAPPNPALEGSNVRHVEIQQTGPARLSIKKNEEPMETDKADKITKKLHDVKEKIKETIKLK